MRYTIQSIKYIAKNFIFLFPFVLVPAFFFACSVDSISLELLLRGFVDGSYPSLTFGQIFSSVSFLGFTSWKTVISGLLGTVTLAVGASLLMAFTDRHMRIGKRGYHGVFSRLNDNILSTAGITLLLLVCYELFAVILSALFFLAFRFTNFVATVIFCSVAYFGMHVVLLFVITLGYLWLPCFQDTGFHTFEALKYSYQLCYPIKGKIMFHQLVLLVVAEALIAASVFIPGDFIVPVLVATLLFSYMIMLFCVRMQVVYFDLAKIERADLKKYYAK
ncbi:MAG: hypothetical protein IKC37_05905 [Clostridia bacterium]|nr:hypothetical protein [Clostridia bacterium]